jgi:ATP synthase protein I
MDPITTIRRRVVFLTIVFLAILMIIWFFTPQKRLVAGFFLGLCVSLYNTLYMSRKVRIAGERAILTGSTRNRGTGMVNRYLMVALAIIIAIEYPGWFDVRAVPFGLPICYILIILLEFWEARRLNHQIRKG